MKTRIALLAWLVLSFTVLAVKAQTGNGTEVLMQGFNWESHKSNWYNVVKNNASDISSLGIDYVWMPPPSDAASNEGYLPRKLYTISSKYGSEAQLRSCINTLHGQGVKVIADIVINHRVGVTDWADFQSPSWGCWSVVANDEWGSNGGNPCGNWDSGDNYGAARDIDHSNSTVRNDLKAWMNWLKNDVGFDGWRYDYVRGYWGGYNAEYNNATSPGFSIGELWDNLNPYNPNPHRQQIVDWIDATQGTSAAFDFTTKGVLQQALYDNNLSLLNINGGAPGVIGWWPAKAVTFLDNHDTGSTQAHWPFPGNRVMEGYAYILTHPGIPMVFWDHVYDWGLKNEIKSLIQIRKDQGLKATSSLVIKKSTWNTYAAEIDGKVAMKIGAGNWSPGAGWTLAASGNNYAVWTKGGSSPSGFTVHFKPSGYSNPEVYFWGVSGANTSWPGTTMTAEGGGWYKYTFPAGNSCANLIFNNNGSSQTADLYRCGEGWYTNGQWYGSQPALAGSAGEGLAAMEPEQGLLSLSSHPNPFVGQTNISFEVPATGKVSLVVFDLMGHEVSTLLNDQLEAGLHTVEFNAEGLSSGLYFCRLTNGKESITQQIIIQ